MWSGNSSCPFFLSSGRFELKLSQADQNLLWKYHEIILPRPRPRPRPKISQCKGSKILLRKERGIWSEQTLGSLGPGFANPDTWTSHVLALCLGCFKNRDNVIYVTGLFQWSSETMDVKLLCKLGSAIQIPLIIVVVLTQFISPAGG